jgi:hypothetical protein
VQDGPQLVHSLKCTIPRPERLEHLCCKLAS